MSKTSLLFVASEVYPFAKTGGLADVAHSLPRALSGEHEVSVVMPLYKCIERERFGIVALEENFNLFMGGIDYPVELYGCTYEGIDYRFIYSPLLCDREFLYGSSECGYEDNDIRFGIFSYAVVELLRRHPYAIVHLNDWQSALIPLLIKQEGTLIAKTLYTIHNLAYQGNFDSSALYKLGISMEYFTMDGVEFHGMVSFMKAGIAYCDCVTTVSPTYAKEILKPEFGCGLDGFLAHHRSKLVGILNGIDTEHFSSVNDQVLVQSYSDISGKALNKKDFLKQSGLIGIKKPLFVFIGRFVSQKGLDLLIEALPKIASLDCNIAFLGEGEARYCEALNAIAKECSNIHLTFGYDESLSRRMYAAADFLLMPSVFEPCGLNQLIAMSYGAIPVVHLVGGLTDTVRNIEKYDSEKRNGFGIVFTKQTGRSFINAINRAMELYRDKRSYSEIANHNMKCDFSWKESAKHYLSLYKKLEG
ncbi:MAG: glycogen/starch synthase [Sulfuricurvum sp.]|nr:glycogen/starch synthase [Sulfuricurvum sp.]